LSAIAIRFAGQSDLDALDRLERAAFTGDRVSRRSLRSFIARGDRLLVAVDADGLAGYALATWRKGGRAVRLYSIAVDPLKAGRGVGRALLAASLFTSGSAIAVSAVTKTITRTALRRCVCKNTSSHLSSPKKLTPIGGQAFMTSCIVTLASTLSAIRAARPLESREPWRVKR
jgi:GNAT superfamily N-acetyltransferase